MSFTENNHNGLIYMSSDKIGARHAFTTRYGGVSTGIFSSLNLGSNRGDDPEAVRENYRRVCELMGVGIDDMAVTQQVHKADVRIVTSADKHVCMSHVPYEADGIVTSERGLPIMCMVADCVPVLLYDGEHSAAGAIHCGWRSSVGDILKNALDAMALRESAERPRRDRPLDRPLLLRDGRRCPSGDRALPLRGHGRFVRPPPRRQDDGRPARSKRAAAHSARRPAGEH